MVFIRSTSPGCVAPPHPGMVIYEQLKDTRILYINVMAKNNSASNQNKDKEKEKNYDWIASYRFLISYNFEKYYWNELGIDEYNAQLKEIERKALDAVKEVIRTDFTSLVNSLFDDQVGVELSNIRKGSITGTISLILVSGKSNRGLTSKYKDFYENIFLIREQLKEMLEEKLTPIFSRIQATPQIAIYLSKPPS